MDNLTAVPTTTPHNVIILGREFVVAGPTDHLTYRSWTLTGPNGAVYLALQHLGPRYERSTLQPFSLNGRDLRIKGNAALVEVQPDGTLRGVR